MLSLPKFLAGILSLVGWLLVEPASAADDYSSAWSPPALSVTLKKVGTPETGMTTWTILSIGTNQFIFPMPAECRLGNSAPQRVVMVSADYNYSFTLRIVGPVLSAVGDDAKTDFYHGFAQTSYPDAKITGEFSRSAANRSGPAFDMLWKNSGGTMQSIRVAYIPTPAGVLEFSLITTADKFSGGQGRFDTWLMTFGDKKPGDQEIVPVSPTG